MKPTICGRPEMRRAKGTRPASATAVQRKVRKECARVSGGFTLLELMVVLVVLTIVATAMVSRAGIETADSAFRRYSADVVDTVLAARARAIDDQTRVFLTMQPTGVDLEWMDPDTGIREHLWSHSESTYGGGVISDSSCNGGLYNGVVAPGEPAASASVGCITEAQELLFLPDGSFRFAGAQTAPAGVTAVIIRKDGGRKTGTVIEVFPGGNVRRLNNVVFE